MFQLNDVLAVSGEELKFLKPSYNIPSSFRQFFLLGKHDVFNDENLPKEWFGVVGARQLDHKRIGFTEVIGKYICKLSYGLITGCAIGSDFTILLSVLENGGVVVCFVASNILDKANDPRLYQYIQSGKLFLISPFNPNDQFRKFQLLQRNQLIYGFSKLVFIVKINLGGGTWRGYWDNFYSHQKTPTVLLLDDKANPNKAEYRVLKTKTNVLSLKEDDFNLQLVKYLKIKKNNGDQSTIKLSLFT